MSDTTTKNREPRTPTEKVKELIDSQIDYERKDKALKKAKQRRKDAFARFIHLLPLGEEVVRLGKRLERGEGGGGTSFSYSEYKKAGHPVTPEMKQFESPRERYPTLKVKPLK